MDHIPSEVIEYLDSHNLSKRITDLQRNISTAVSSGLLVAEIIHAKYPKLIEMHNFIDSSNFQGKMSNWSVLNKKLSLFRCSLEPEQINSIVNRSGLIDPVQFLAKLIARLPSYEPIYLAKQLERSSAQAPSKPSVNKIESDSVKESSPDRYKGKFYISTNASVAGSVWSEAGASRSVTGKSRTGAIIAELSKKKERAKKFSTM